MRKRNPTEVCSPHLLDCFLLPCPGHTVTACIRFPFLLPCNRWKNDHSYFFTVNKFFRLMSALYFSMFPCLSFQFSWTMWYLHNAAWTVILPSVLRALHMPAFDKAGNWMPAAWQIEQASAKAVVCLAIAYTPLWVLWVAKWRGFCLNISCHSTHRRSRSSNSAQTS